MDDSDQPSPSPMLSFGPGMRTMLLVSLSFACILILQMFAKWETLSWLSPSIDNGYPVYYTWIAYMVYSIFVFAVPALIYANVFPMERFGYFRLGNKVSPLVVVYGVLVMLLLFPVFNEILERINNSLTNQELIDFRDENAKLNAWAYQMPGFGNFIFCLFANAFVPAVCEELFFRAGIQQILLERSRFRHVSIISTALIFTFFHLDPLSFPVIFIAGLILGYTFYRTGSLRITILMHFMFNGISLFLEYLAQHNASVRAWQPGMAVIIPCTLAAGGLFFLVWKSAKGGSQEIRP